MFKQRSASQLSPRFTFLGAFALVAVLSVPAAVISCGGGDSNPGGGGGDQDAGLDAADGQVGEGGDDTGTGSDAKTDAPKDTGTGDVKKDVGNGDSDGDGVPDNQDKCPGFDDKADSDGDGTPDGCELCPGQDESADMNGNGVPDCAESVRLWLRADQGVMTQAGGADAGTSDGGSMSDGGASPDAGAQAPAADGDPVVVWKDRSLGGHDALQADPNRRPTWVKAAGASGPAVHFEGMGNPGDGSTVADDDSLDGSSVIQGDDARTVFVVARQASGKLGGASALLELNRADSFSTGAGFRVTPELGLRVGNGQALFAHQPLGEQFHVIALDVPQSSTCAHARVWFDGIPMSASSTTSVAIHTGGAGFRIGDGAPVGMNGFTGDIAEVLVYGKQLTGEVRNAVGYDLEKRHELKTSYAPATVAATPVPMYIVIGGDNAAGYGKVENLTNTYKTIHGDVMLWRDSSVGFKPLGPGEGASSAEFGPELTMGPQLVKSSEQAAIIFKHAEPGQTLDRWDPSTGPAYSNFITTLTSARDKLTASGINYQITGVAWIHGEQDAADQNKAMFYQSGLNNLVLSLRNVLGEQNLPIAIATLPPNLPSASYAYASVVTTAQNQVASDNAKVQIVDTSSVSVGSDGVHYDELGQIKLGSMFADTLKGMAK